MAKRQSQANHDRMIGQVAKLLTGKNYKDVKADLEGYTAPRKIVWESTGEGHIPDITAYSSQLKIFEVETMDSIRDEHTENQWKLFASYAKTNNALFYIVFPKGAADQVQSRLKELNIEACLMEAL